MTDLTIDRAAQLAEPVRDALPSASAEQRVPAPVRGARTGEVRLTRLLALAALSPAQAVEVGAGLLAAVELDQVREQVDPDDGGPAIDRIMVDVDGRVAIGPDRGPAACERLGRGRRPRRVCRPARRARRRVRAQRRPRGTP